ncbi:MAG: carboxylesterase family protein [Anaerolineae bacterium]|nr:carboxylesterase family protein [Gloeobacterales cyanobacterium ES-bin-313]
MYRIVCLLLIALLLEIGPVNAQQPITLITDKGPVAGLQTPTVTTFFGIPYASPPSGDLRWRAPQPTKDWITPLQTTTFGNECVQVASGLFNASGKTKGQVTGDEDCLYLNVYTPNSAVAKSQLPVMVWIHGGGFTFGAGSLYDGSVLAQKYGVVVVTLNYRLGPLGFLALSTLSAEADGSSGNYGLLDQQAALVWVQKNISAFGGDPKNVTLFGESAGGLSICAHLASPQSAGLFQKAIIQSGFCTSPNNNVSLAEASRRNRTYGIRVGCPDANSTCLRKMDISTLMSTQVPGLRGLGNLVWSPVYGAGSLPLSLKTAFARGAFNRVPILQGTNHDEGRLFISVASPDGDALPLFKYWAGTGLLVGAAKNPRVLAQYPARTYSTPTLAFATVFTDAMFSCPALEVDSALSKYVPVFAFEFNDPKAVTSLKTPAGLPSLGAFHSSSLVYVFQTPLVGIADPAKFNPKQRALSDALGLSWANFVKNGNPNLTDGSQWRKFDPKRKNVQTFTPTGIAEKTIFADDHKCGFWSKLGLN